MPRRSTRIAAARAAAAIAAAAAAPPPLPMDQETALLILETESRLTEKFFNEGFVMPFPVTNRFLAREVHPVLHRAVSFAQELANLRDPSCQDVHSSLRDILTRMRAFLNGAFDEEVQAFRQRVLTLVEAAHQNLPSYSQG
jgi:hypothetical protein